MKAEEGTYRHWYATMADFKISFPTLSHPRHKCFHTTFWFTSNHFHYLNTLFTAILYYIYYMNIYPCSIAMNTIDSVVRYMPLMPQHTWVWDNWGGAMLIARSSLGKTRGRQQWKDASLHQCILPRIAMRPYRLSSWVVRSGTVRRTSRYRKERTCWGKMQWSPSYHCLLWGWKPKKVHTDIGMRPWPISK